MSSFEERLEKREKMMEEFQLDKKAKYETEKKELRTKHCVWSLSASALRIV